MLDPRQVLGQGLTTGALAWGFRHRRADSFASGVLFRKMGFASGDVGGEGFVEKVRLNAAPRFALDAKPDPSQVRERSRELFDLRVTPANLLVARESSSPTRRSIQVRRSAGG